MRIERVICAVSRATEEQNKLLNGLRLWEGREGFPIKNLYPEEETKPCRVGWTPLTFGDAVLWSDGVMELRDKGKAGDLL